MENVVLYSQKKKNEDLEKNANFGVPRTGIINQAGLTPNSD
jgi:hypothetical protein